MNIIKKVLSTTMAISLSVSMYSGLGFNLESTNFANAAISSENEENVLYFKNIKTLAGQNPKEATAIIKKIQSACKTSEGIFKGDHSKYTDYGIIYTNFENSENFIMLYDRSKYDKKAGEGGKLIDHINDAWAEGYVKYLNALRDLSGISHEYVVIKADAPTSTACATTDNGTVHLPATYFVDVATAAYNTTNSSTEWKTTWSLLHESSHLYGDVEKNPFDYHSEISVNTRLICAMHFNNCLDSVSNIMFQEDVGSNPILSVYDSAKKYKTVSAQQYLTYGTKSSYDKFLKGTVNDYYPKSPQKFSDNVYNQHFLHQSVYFSYLLSNPVWNYTYKDSKTIKQNFANLSQANWNKLYAMQMVYPENVTNGFLSTAKQIRQNYDNQKTNEITVIYYNSSGGKSKKPLKVTENTKKALEKYYNSKDKLYHMTWAMVEYYNIVDIITESGASTFRVKCVDEINNIKNTNNMTIIESIESALNPPKVRG